MAQNRIDRELTTREKTVRKKGGQDQKFCLHLLQKTGMLLNGSV